MGCCLHAAKWVILKLFLLQHLHVLKAPRQELFTACDMFPTAVTSFIKFVMVIKKALSKRKFHQQTSTKPIKKNVLLCMAQSIQDPEWVILKLFFAATSPCVKSSWQESVAANDVFSIAVTSFIKFVIVVKKTDKVEVSSMDQYKTGQEEFTCVHEIVFTCCQTGYSKAVFLLQHLHV